MRGWFSCSSVLASRAGYERAGLRRRVGRAICFGGLLPGVAPAALALQAFLTLLEAVHQNEPSHSERQDEGNGNDHAQDGIAKTFVQEPMHVGLVDRGLRQSWRA
jgi:hypothetical protein